MPNQNPSPRQILSFYLSQTKKFKYWWLCAFVFISIGATGSNYAPVILQNLIELLEQNEASPKVVQQALGFVWQMVFVYSAGEIAWRLSNYFMDHAKNKTLKRLTDTAFSVIHTKDYQFFVNAFAGGLVSKVNRMQSAFYRMADIVLWTFWLRLIDVAIISFFLWQFELGMFALVLILWMTAYIWGMWRFSIWNRPYQSARAASKSVVTGILADTITNFLGIKTFAQLQNEEKRFANATETQRKARQRTDHHTNMANIGKFFSMIPLEAGILYYGITSWGNGTMTISLLVLLQVYVLRITEKMWSFNQVVQEFYVAFADSEEMVQIIQTPAKIQDISKPETCMIKKGEITFKNVQFAYDDLPERPILDNFSLSITAGQKVGLVGVSGAGKSTITKLLLRFADANGGEICIDGQNIAKITQKDLRKNIAYVPQEPVLFHRTLAENIAYGMPNAGYDAVKNASVAANAYEFIEKSPKGFETLVGERGIKLSGGERQRIAIARAMLKKAPVLILDEATSSLDSHSETAIATALHELFEGKTVLAIAHRLSTLKEMDRILVLQAGSVVEDGNHAELLAKKGVYFDLWNV